MTSYCKNCGAVLPEGAHFCASCGTPVQIYINMPCGGNMQAGNCAAEYPDGAQALHDRGVNAIPYAPGNPSGAAYQNASAYPNGAVYQNTPVYPSGAACQNASAYPNSAAYQNTPVYPSGAAYQNASAYPNGEAYQNTSAYGRELQIYADGPVYGNSIAPHGGGIAPQGGGMASHGGGMASYGGGMAPYAEGQTYGGGQPEYGQAYGNDAKMYAAGGNYAGNPYDPYGKAVQPQSSRKALMIMGMIIGLAVVIAVILLIVLLAGDKSHRTYQQAAGVFMDGLEGQSLERLSEAFPERVREDLRREMFGTLRQEYGESASDFYVESDFWTALNEALDWYCGENVTMSYTITSEEPIEDYRLREYERNFLEDFHYTVSFDGGYVVKIAVVYRGSEGEYTSRLSLKTAEIDEKWYVIDFVYD